ncbi:MAG: TolC family protein [Candidatus Amulumruptor caecigallinarius]|nr:TolC family protein [Candidatus Amulumruptor caecigallinarius]MCM1397482.1 TolC family protein [Candidatus Amulumruptor caecigallinarius]MCM1454384.1 TolC family protein [bacterium]
MISNKMIYAAMAATAALFILPAQAAETADSVAATTVCPATQSVDTLYLTLDRCREMALSGNAATRTAANNLKAASETSKEAFTKYFPEISASGMAFWANHDVLQYDVLDMFEIGLIKKGVIGGVMATQPIFAGGQIVNGNALAKVGAKVAELRSVQTQEEVAVTVDKYYWKLVSLNSQKETLASLLVMLDTLAYQTKAAVDAGVILKNDFLKVEIQRNEYRATMIDLDNGIALCSNLLGQYIGAGLTPVKVTQSVTPGDSLGLAYDIWREPCQAVTSTPAYGMLSSAVKAAELEKKLAVGKNLPTVGFGAGWFYHNLLEQDQNFGALFISVSVPITAWWGGSHAIKKKNLELENARIQMEDGEQMLQIAMRDAWDNLTAAYRKAETAAETVNQSRENLRLNENYYKVGVSTITDLLDAQTLYKKACDQYTTAYADYQVRTAEYLKATAQLPLNTYTPAE